MPTKIQLISEPFCWFYDVLPVEPYPVNKSYIPCSTRTNKIEELSGVIVFRKTVVGD